MGGTLALVLPETLDPETLRTGIMVLIAILLIAAVAGWYLVKKMVSRVIFFGLLLGFGAILWGERGELKTCQKTCSCRILSWDVQVPGCANLEGGIPTPLGLPVVAGAPPAI